MGLVLRRRGLVVGRVCAAGLCSILVLCLGGVGAGAKGKNLAAAGGGSAFHSATPGWFLQSAAVPSGSTGFLSGVSCTSGASCTAVGTWSRGDRVGVLVELSRGSRWMLERTRPYDAVLSGASCTARRTCAAVGSIEHGFGQFNLLIRWNGARASATPSRPPLNYTDFADLSGVSCASVTACMAVGSAQDCGDDGCQVIAEAARWDGSKWSVESIASRPRWYDTGLSAVSCTSATACVAVGYYDITQGCDYGGSRCVQFPLVERWNGAQWSMQSIAKQGGGSRVGLSGVSCATMTACTAVGAFVRGILVEQWNGSAWSVERIAKPLGGTAIHLVAVSCSSSSACTAVGDFIDATGQQVPLAERLADSRWSIQQTPSLAGATSAVLTGVSCTPTACTAVGGLIPATASPAVAEPIPLVMRWQR